MMKNIVVDIDGCVSNFDFGVITQKYFGVSVPNSKLECYSIENCLGISPRDIDSMLSVECKAPPKFIPGAIDTLKGWLAKDYDVLILTSRLKYQSMSELVEWLERAHIPYTGILSMDSLPSYIHAQVDDNPSKLLQVSDEVTVKHSILFSQPWNRRCLNIKGVLEVAKNWKEVKEIINGR